MGVHKRKCLLAVVMMTMAMLSSMLMAEEYVEKIRGQIPPGKQAVVYESARYRILVRTKSIYDGKGATEFEVIHEERLGDEELWEQWKEDLAPESLKDKEERINEKDLPGWREDVKRRQAITKEEFLGWCQASKETFIAYYGRITEPDDMPSPIGGYSILGSMTDIVSAADAQAITAIIALFATYVPYVEGVYRHCFNPGEYRLPRYIDYTYEDCANHTDQPFYKALPPYRVMLDKNHYEENDTLNLYNALFERNYSPILLEIGGDKDARRGQ